MNLSDTDKISSLPDELLVKILSFLPTKLAVSTSVLSKRWKFLWMYSPKLDYAVTRRSVRDFINKNMPLHRAPVIESFRLELLCYFKPEDIKLWIEIAISRFVRELELEISHFSPFHCENILPSSIYTCKSLVVLKLREVTLVGFLSTGYLPSLKTLRLLNVKYADDEILQHLLSICPVLENLDVRFFYDYVIKRFSVIVPSLKKLSLFIPGELYLDGYEIDTPSLKYFRLHDWSHKVHYTFFCNMPELREAYVNTLSLDLKSIIGSITSVKHLTICSKDVYGDGFVFNQLEHLMLCVCKRDSSNLLARLLKDSPNLRVLDISLFRYHQVRDSECNDMVCWKQPSDVPECLLSSLQIFKWSRYFGRPTDRETAVYILKNAYHLKIATIQADTKVCNVTNREMMEELTLSPRASSTCQLGFVDDTRSH